MIGVFPLFVPPFFLPSYATTVGLSTGTAAGLVAAFNVASLVGRLSFGASSDRFGALNCLIMTLVINAFSFLVIWPVSTSIVPLIFFVLLNGAANVRPLPSLLLSPPSAPLLTTLPPPPLVLPGRLLHGHPHRGREHLWQRARRRRHGHALLDLYRPVPRRESGI